MGNIISKENFVKDFIKNFVPTISIKQLKKLKCYAPNHGYLWMVCEHNLVENLKGDDAMTAYDNVDKTGAVEFQYDNGFMGDDISIPLSKENDSSIKIKNSGLIEFYVIGKDFSWCYIVTHERDGCGPYFIINKTTNSMKADIPNQKTLLALNEVEKMEKNPEKFKGYNSVDSLMEDLHK